MTTTKTGNQAETKVAEALVRRGFRILQQNWRTRYCEIDVVAQKQSVMYFVEVKFRATDQQGDGLEYITHRKLQQMHFAAEMWCQAHHWGGDYEIAAIAVSGPDFAVADLRLCS